MVTVFHTLEDFTERLKERGLLIEAKTESDVSAQKVRYITFNSLDVKYGSLFVCKGAHFKEEYLAGALKEGAFAYLSEQKYEDLAADVPYIIVNDIRKAMIVIADFYYNKVWEKLTITGITGTKGKSTTTYFMKYILDDYLKSQKKPQSAVISGIDNYDGIINEESHLTTPEAMDLYRHFDNAVTSGIEYLTMEVSSQALKYDRVSEVIFDTACFLNIGEDHISDVEHPDFEDYASSKMILFGQCKTACINIESEFGQRALETAKKSPLTEKVITFGRREEADIYGYDIETSSKYITFKARSDSFDCEFKIAMHGLFNVDNALAAIAMCYGMNIPLEHIISGLKKARVSGRMEIYTNADKDISVIVDYAHNKMSFESLFKSTQKEFPGKKISIVFGCPGKKALGRRKELGELAGRYTDRVFITEEDAGEEPVMKICEEIAKHVTNQDTQCSIITDREKAIAEAIEEADRNTVVLITGKGRETRQKRGTQYIDTPSDVEMVKTFLKNK